MPLSFLFRPTRVRSTSPTVFFNFLNMLPDLANLTRQLKIPLRIAFVRSISRSQQGINAVFCSRSVTMCCITSLFFPRNQPRPDESKTHNIEAKGFQKFHILLRECSIREAFEFWVPRKPLYHNVCTVEEDLPTDSCLPTSASPGLQR